MSRTSFRLCGGFPNITSAMKVTSSYTKEADVLEEVALRALTRIDDDEAVVVHIEKRENDAEKEKLQAD